jgi:hypothetical protein
MNIEQPTTAEISANTTIDFDKLTTCTQLNLHYKASTQLRIRRTEYNIELHYNT